MVTCLLVNTSCVVYTEKQSEALSRSVYLSKDSFDKGRFDITDVSLTESVKLVKVPKKRAKVEEVEKVVDDLNKTVKTSSSHKPIISEVKSTIKTLINPQQNQDATNKKKVIIIPDRFKDREVIIVDSVEYKELLKDKETFKQLQGDYKQLVDLKKEVDKELSTQLENKNKMVIALNEMQKDILKKNLLITKLYIVIFVLCAAIGGGIYLRIKGIL
jgi:hypothetical protein